MSEHEVVIIEKQVDLIEVGVSGKQGARGFTYTPRVIENGILGWTNDGDLPNPPNFDLATIVDVPVSISNQEIFNVIRS